MSIPKNPTLKLGQVKKRLKFWEEHFSQKKTPTWMKEKVHSSIKSAFSLMDQIAREGKEQRLAALWRDLNITELNLETLYKDSSLVTNREKHL